MKEKSLTEIFNDRAQRWSARAAFRRRFGRTYTDMAWREAGDQFIFLSLAFSSLGMKKGDRVGILSWNRPEWLLVDLAVMAVGGMTVPIFISLPPEEISYILADSGAKYLAVENKELWKKVEPVITGLSQPPRIILIEDHGQAGGPHALSYESLIASGRDKFAAQPYLFQDLLNQVGENDSVTIIYTSGTTGQPKGVVLTHKSFISGGQAARQVLPTQQGDVALSFLPLAHVYERFTTYSNLEKGVVVAFAQGPDTVMRDLPEVRPTVLFAVPLFFDRIYGRLRANLAQAPFWRKAVFYACLGIGKRIAQHRMAKKEVPLPLKVLSYFADRLSFSKLKKRLGGRIRFFVSGGAALSPEVAEFFLAFGLPIFQGYGLTESCAVCSVNNFDNFKLDSVGKPCPAVQVKIAADGEVLITGDVILSEYWGDPLATAAAKRDGWLHTGDTGHLDADGFLKILDRKKDILVTSLGENVAPQKIEALLRTDPLISDAVVLGDGQPYLCALIVPDFEGAAEYAKRERILYQDPQEILAHPKFQAYLESVITIKNEGLAPFEQIRKFQVIPHSLSQAGGELTPTLKVKRKIILERHRPLIDSMYKT